MDRTANYENEIARMRAAKLAKLNKEGFAWPDGFDVTTELCDFDRLDEGIEDISIAGRVVSMRSFGRLTFGHISDYSGIVQFAFQRSHLGDDFPRAIAKIDRGDHVGLTGTVMITRTGEKTLDVRSYSLLSKSLRPLPEKFHGVADRELKMRNRYLELVMSRDAVERFLTRTRIVRYLRNYLDDHRFIEIDTPVLVGTASGANAKPFVADYDALSIPVHLRIAPETYLKRAVAGGFKRVYEFARCFRNEGIDPSHLPDFTMLEFYASYWNYRDMLEFTRAMLQSLVHDLGLERITSMVPDEPERRDGTIEFTGEWPVVSMRDLLVEYAGIDVETCTDVHSVLESLKNRSRNAEIARFIAEEGSDETSSYAGLIDHLFKKLCRPHLVNPTFVVGHPVAMSPLARRNDENPRISDRFQLVVGGLEVVNAYSELVDPIDQRIRLEKQATLREKGDPEAMDVDEDFLRCMEHGMPPMSGFGMGIDRLAALLTGVENLRDMVLFPLLRPE